MFGRLAPSPSCSSSADRPFPPSSPTFLHNKLAQALAALIRLEYSTLWPSPFLHLLPYLSFVVDMFARLLAALDDDLLNQDYPRSPAEAATASRITDSMRHQRVPQIAEKKIKATGGAVLLIASPPQFTSYSRTIYNDRFIPGLFSRPTLLAVATCPPPVAATGSRRTQGKPLGQHGEAEKSKVSKRREEKKEKKRRKK